MEEAIARYISDKLVREKIILSEFRDVYVYGFELILSFLTATFMILLVGIIFHKTILTLVFLLIFIALRRFTGGYHATTYLKCKITTISTYVVVITSSQILGVSAISYIPLFVVGFIMILRYCPIENIHKPLTLSNKIKNKVLSLILFSAIISFGLIMHSKFQQLSNTIFYTLVSIVVLIIIPILRKGGKANEKKNHKVGS